MSILRRSSYSQARDVPEPADTDSRCRRTFSMSEFTRLKGRLKLGPLSTKASPAECAVTACSVRTASLPKLNTVYEHPSARYRPDESEKLPTKTAQTVFSGASTYQMLWEEPPRADSESDTSIVEHDDEPIEEAANDDDDLLSHVSRDPSPMGQVKTKLSAWSWAREHELEEDGHPRWIPLMAFDESRPPSRLPSIISPAIEEPPAPPNTAKGSGASSARHSSPQSPEQTSADDSTPNNNNPHDEEIDDADSTTEQSESPIELRIKATLARSSSTPLTVDFAFPSSSTLTIPIPPHPHSGPPSPNPTPTTPRQLSNLATEDEHFRLHRDSIELLQRKVHAEEKWKMNQNLMNTRDSFVIARAKQQQDGVMRRPRAASSGGGWTRFGGLEVIADASPPEDARVGVGVRGMAELAGDVWARKGEGFIVEEVVERHPEEHVGCRICEVDRPRWFAQRYMKGLGGFMV